MKLLRFILVTIIFLGNITIIASAQTTAPISFGDAQSFSVLANTTVTNTGNTKVSCNVGTFPGTSIVAFDYPTIQIDGETILGSKQSATALAASAQTSAQQLFTYLWNTTSPAAVDLTTTSFVNSTTLQPGIYSFSSSALLGAELILDDSNDPNAVFIFKTVSTLITQTYSTVKMKSGGRGRNVFWLVGSSATIETYAHFVGNIIAHTSISIKTGAVNTGKLFALGAAVTMDFNNVDLGNIDCSGTIAAVDTDGDTVPDNDDDYPLDPTKAWNNYSSTVGGSTAAFEDLWPSTGDYDMNDVVMAYKYNVITNAQSIVVGVIGNFTLNAVGGSQNNGFGVEFPILSSQVTNLEGTTLESGQDKATIILFQNMHNELSMWNTQAGQAVPVKNYTISFNVINGPTINDFGLSFNPFIFHTENGSRREVHLPGKKPTKLADVSVFGTLDDATSAATNTYYLTKKGLPYAIELPIDNFSYPMEGVDISKAYTHFGDWAIGSGITFTDWFNNLATGYRTPFMIWVK